jgi:hypothetical protein
MTNLKTKSFKDQAETKHFFSKPSKLHLYRLEIYKLKKGFSLAVADDMILKILRNGKLKEDQMTIAKSCDLSRKSTNKSICRLVNLGIIKKVHSKQKWDPRKNGICTYYLGSACFNIEKLKILFEVLPSLGVVLQAALNVEKEAWDFGQKLSTERLQHKRVINRKKGVTAILRILNNNPYSSYPNPSSSFMNMNKECVRAREKVCVTNLEKDITKKRAIETVENLPKTISQHPSTLAWLARAKCTIINGKLERV